MNLRQSDGETEALPPGAPSDRGDVAGWLADGVWLTANTDNVASVPVAEKAGFRREGTLRRAGLEATGVLAKVVRGVPAPPVVCGDFNLDRGSVLFGRFVASAGLADAFEGNCPATFRAEYLPAGATPHCIDYILTGDGVKAEAADVMFAEREPLPGGPGMSPTTSGCVLACC